MIKGKTLVKRKVYTKPRGVEIGEIEANKEIIATENLYQWLHLIDGGWVSAGPEQQYIKWEETDEPIEPVDEPTPPPVELKKIIKGKTIVKRFLFDRPHGKKIGLIHENKEITASENQYQWLHLVSGSWVSAGPKQQYIKWEEVMVPIEPVEEPPSPPKESKKIIKGRTLVKRFVFDKPRGEKNRLIAADKKITASENQYQWLHLIDGGWVNAGPNQEYVQWDFVTVPIEPPKEPEPIVTPPPPREPWEITEIKRKGRIATLLVDWQNPKWSYEPRHAELGRKLKAYPATVTFSPVLTEQKGDTIPLTKEMEDYVTRINGERTKDVILTPGSGWVNVPTAPGTIEMLSWAANHVVVKEIKTKDGVEYANVHAISCYETDLIGDFFDKDMRLVLHKFNAAMENQIMINIGNDRDCYTPFISNPKINNGDMWIPVKYLELWPKLPFTLDDGTEVIEYELFGHKVYGLRADGKSVLLRDRKGFKTSWKIDSPDLPF